MALKQELQLLVFIFYSNLWVAWQICCCLKHFKPRRAKGRSTKCVRLKVARQHGPPSARERECLHFPQKYSEICSEMTGTFFVLCSLFSAGIPGLWVWWWWLPDVVWNWGISLWYIRNSLQHKRWATSSRYHGSFSSPVANRHFANS